MSEMVERVMKAMQDVPPLPPVAGGYYATDWEGMARAAIAALREPTEGMERVAWEVSDDGNNWHTIAAPIINGAVIVPTAHRFFRMQATLEHLGTGNSAKKYSLAFRKTA